jgi:hypothetical protein
MRESGFARAQAEAKNAEILAPQKKTSRFAPGRRSASSNSGLR